MGSIGSKTTTLPDYFNGRLGERSNEDSITRLTRVNNENSVNPNYTVDRKYRTNCALCVVAVALQAMGYDVEAMPRDKEWRGFNSVFDVDWSNPDNYILHGSKSNWYWEAYPNSKNVSKRYGIENVPTMPKGADKAAQAIIDKAKSWGNGAVGALSVQWKNTSSAHVINIINQDGRVFGYDGQSNRVIHDLSTYLKRTAANNSALARLDNATVKKDIPDLDKMVKRRKK